jgi:transposase-like protein
MATTYSPDFKASIIAKMLPPNNVSVPELVQETGIPKDTLYSWRAKARRDGPGAPATPAPARALSSEEKFAIVLETAALSEVELGEYCRRQGLYPQEIAAWTASCQQANRVISSQAERAQLRTQKHQIQDLEQELRRKEKALAEAAALLMLEKKARDLFTDRADARSTPSSERP